MPCSIPVTTTIITGLANEKQTDTSLDALRRALLQALMDQGLVNEQQIREMLAENEGKFQRLAARRVVESIDRATGRRRLSNASRRTTTTRSSNNGTALDKVKFRSRCRATFVSKSLKKD